MAAVVAERRARPEYGVLAVMFCLALLGLAAVSTASYAFAGSHPGIRDSFYFIIRHAAYLFCAAVVFIASLRLSRSSWRAAAFWFLGLSLVLCVLVFVPGLGKTVNGAKRWLAFGPVQLQPSEFLKVGLILGLSAWLSTAVGSPRRLWPGFLLAVGGILLSAAIVMKQDDLGTTIVLMGVGVLLLYCAAAPARFLAPTLAVLCLLGVLAVLLEPYRMQRVYGWLDPWKHSADKGYQVVQSLYAFGNGGLWGQGIGQGIAKYYLPAPHTDFIFATVAEETGFFGPLAIIGLYTWLGVMGIRVARRSKSLFARLAAVGVVAYLCGQAVLNVLVVTGALPCTGVPLPLISYGGSSLLSAAMALGLLYSLSRSAGGEYEEEMHEGGAHRRRYGGAYLPRAGGGRRPVRGRR